MRQEYIKGDIVMYDDEIHTIIDTLGLNNYELSNVEYQVYRDELSGVPITPKILEKNWWKHKKEFGEYWFIPRNEDYELLALDKVGEEWAIYIEENCSNFEYIKFVHQLQHLLFGLGLNSEMEIQK